MDIVVKHVAAGTAFAGRILLSHPSMRNDTFQRTAIFLFSHNDGGAMGIILNRPSTRVVGEAAMPFAYTALANVPLYFGGPVTQESFMFAAWHGSGDGGHHMKCGLNREQAGDILSSMPDARVRCFHGHAAWGAGQLEKELEANGWIFAPLDFSLLNGNDGVALWRHFLKKYHPSHYLLAIGPEDPSQN